MPRISIPRTLYADLDAFAIRCMKNWTMTGEQLRAARALLKIGSRELAALAGVDKMSIVGCENGRRTQTATVAKIRSALEVAGIVFLDGRHGDYQPTAALRWGIRPGVEQQGRPDDEATGKPGEGLHSRAWDEDCEEAEDGGDNMSDEDRASLRRYYEEHPERWAKLSALGKACLAKAMRLNDTSTAP